MADPKLEEALRVRIDFMLFTGMGIENDVPDETTICRFRNKLVRAGLEQELFEEVNRQLEFQGLKVKKAIDAVIDASVIESAARPNRCLEIAEDRNEEEGINICNDGESETKQSTQEEVVAYESVDPDAKWLKKEKKVILVTNYF